MAAYEEHTRTGELVKNKKPHISGHYSVVKGSTNTI
jgi:hypothetical protein